MISTKVYLDKRSKLKKGGYPLKLRINVHRQAAYISMDLTLPAEQWDPIRLVVKKNCANSKKLNDYIVRRKAQIDDCIRTLTLEGALVRLSASAVRDAILRRMYPGTSSGAFLAHYKSFALSHENPRTRDIYNATISAMVKYDEDLEIREFTDIDKKWIDGFFAWLPDNGCVSVNARNIHLRNIRAAFNNAIDTDLTTFYPFRKVKIRPVETRKRSLSVEVLRSIFSASVPEWQQKYVDAFKLIFLLIGINTIDLLHLKYSDLNDGRVSYTRAKTKRLYDIKVEPEAQEIMSRYPGQNKILCFDESCSTYVNFSNRLNKNLSSIHKGLTTYYARHSWATIASSLDIPKETIAAALGHGGRTVTDIYIDFDAKKVDAANRKVIDWVLYGKRD